MAMVWTKGEIHPKTWHFLCIFCHLRGSWIREHEATFVWMRKQTINDGCVTVRVTLWARRLTLWSLWQYPVSLRDKGTLSGLKPIAPLWISLFTDINAQKQPKPVSLSEPDFFIFKQIWTQGDRNLTSGAPFQGRISPTKREGGTSLAIA